MSQNASHRNNSIGSPQRPDESEKVDERITKEENEVDGYSFEKDDEKEIPYDRDSKVQSVAISVEPTPKKVRNDSERDA